MKTSDSIEQQPERKAARDNGDDQEPAHSTPTSKPPERVKMKKLDASLIAAWKWKPGQPGNPTGKNGWNDLAAVIARAAFENNAEALYKAFSKALLKGNAYAFKELSDRAYGRLKERIEVEAGPLRSMSEADLKARVAELEAKLGYVPTLPPVSEDDPKVN